MSPHRRRLFPTAPLLLAALIMLLCFCACAGEAAPPPADGRTVITVATLFGREDDTITRTVAAFNEAQEEIWVELVSYYQNHDSSAADEQRMYASFLTGDPPDLYYTLSIDPVKLRNAGLITDWYPVMQADETFHKEAYQTHIWELLETEGHLYELCTSFDLSGISGPKELFEGRTGWTLDEFRAFLAEHSDTAGIGRERLLQMMLWYGTQLEFIDLETNTCQYDTPAFYDWLALLQELPESCPPEKELHPSRVGNAQGHIGRLRSDGYYARVAGLPSQHATGPGVSGSDSYALSSKTAHLEACWTFVKWLLAPEQQADEMANDIPMHKAVWEDHLRRAGLDGWNKDSLFYKNTIVPGVNDGGGNLVGVPGTELREVDGELWEVETLRHPGLPPEEIAYLRDTVANAGHVSVYAFHYQDVTTIVEEEILAFLAGDKSAEECAQLIQSRVSTLLAEWR